MPQRTDPRLLVLHGLRLRGFGSPDDVAAIAALGADDVEDLLAKLAADELVVHREGRLTGWALTPAGRDEHERLLAEEVDRAGHRPGVGSAYRRFLSLNPELLRVCTDWQIRGSAVNDHTDASYDREVVARLGELHRRLLPVLDELEAGLDRYRGYRGRFQRALDRLSAGEPDWFTKPMIDSYHTVWFQLHEDLLATLGLVRADEDVVADDPEVRR